jgi:hypothetical protein
MKTILGMSIAAAGFLLAASSAFAADDEDCHGGYRLIAGTPIVCGGYTPMLSSSPPPVEEPLYTGSIAASAAPTVSHSPTAEHRMMMVSGPQDCTPGAYWLMPNPNEDTPISCPR